MHRTSPRGARRGFTLVEMLTVVVLVGVLATLAVYGVRKYILSAKTSEATAMMTSIKTAEEAFKDETFIYLDVSGSFANDKFYPSTSPSGAFKTQWGGPGADASVTERFRTLGIQADAPVMFAYAVVATAPGGTIPTFPTGMPRTKADFNLPDPVTRWTYVAMAWCNLDQGTGMNDVDTYVVSHSYSNEVSVENEGM